MKKFFLKKIVTLLLSLFTIASLTFFLMRAIPGDPFTEDRVIPEEIMKAMYHHYGLNDSWYIQYGRYLKGIITLNLGPSFKYEGRTVNEVIANSFPVSLILGGEALLLSSSIGIVLGSLAALKHAKWQDHLIMIVTILGVSIPSFILATFLQYIFSMKLDLLPIARWGTFSQSILPALSLAALPTAFITRLTRTNMIEVLHQDYIQTAKSKGLSSYQIIWRHALRNSLLPVITYLGPLTASIITGSFIVEKIFGIPGLGQWFVMSVSNRDYTVVMGITLFYSVLLISAVFLVDILYGFIDPRIKRSIFNG